MTIDHYRFWILTIMCGLVFYAGYQTGYQSAQIDYSKPVRYKCYDGIVHRDTMGYWEVTNQACKTHAQLASTP